MMKESLCACDSGRVVKNEFMFRQREDSARPPYTSCTKCWRGNSDVDGRVRAEKRGSCMRGQETRLSGKRRQREFRPVRGISADDRHGGRPFSRRIVGVTCGRLPFSASEFRQLLTFKGKQVLTLSRMSDHFLAYLLCTLGSFLSWWTCKDERFCWQTIVQSFTLGTLDFCSPRR
jgi:hypothetical protein